MSFNAKEGGSTPKSSQPQRIVQPGDLVLSQGALLGEISTVSGDCFEMIPTASQLSSFEVQLEQSGIRGVAVGLGDQRESIKSGLHNRRIARSLRCKLNI